MKKIFTLSALILASSSIAAPWRFVPFKCGFDVPRMHRDQSWGLYVAVGASMDEAKSRAVQSCKGELEPYFPGKCEELAEDSYRWACNWSHRWEF
jgi:hypothetical protein